MDAAQNALRPLNRPLTGRSGDHAVIGVMRCLGLNLLLVNVGSDTIAHTFLDEAAPVRIAYAKEDSLDFSIEARRDLLALCGGVS